MNKLQLQEWYHFHTSSSRSSQAHVVHLLCFEAICPACVKISGQTTFRFSHFRYPACHSEFFTTNINHRTFVNATKASISSLQEIFT